MTTAPSTSDLEKEDSNSESESEESLGTQAEIEEVGPCKLKLSAEVSAEKVAELLDKNYRDLIRNLQLPGFRPGRVPKALVEKRYGEAIEKDLKEALLSDSFLEVVRDKEINVVGKPKFDEVRFEKDAPFSYEVELEIRPEFEIGEYRGIEVQEEKLPVSEEDVEEELTSLRQRHASLVPVELSEADSEDWYFASYRLIKDGEEVHKAENIAFRPVDETIDSINVSDLGLKEKVAGLSDEEKLELQVKLPSQLPSQLPQNAPLAESLSGAEVTMELTVSEAKRVGLPELDDDFAKIFQLETVQQLRQKVEENLKTRNRFREQRNVEEAVLKKIEDSVDFPLPEGILEDQKKSHKVRLQNELIQMGKSKEEIEEELKKAESVADDDIRKEIKRFFILDKIAEKEKIFATEEDIQARVSEIASVYQRKPEEVLQELNQSNRFEEMRIEICHGKVREFLRKKAKISRKNGTSENVSKEESSQT